MSRKAKGQVYPYELAAALAPQTQRSRVMRASETGNKNCIMKRGRKGGKAVLKVVDRGKSRTGSMEDGINKVQAARSRC